MYHTSINMAKSKENNFENQMNRLKEIVETLEKDNIDIDKSLSLYQEGINLSKELKSTLSDFEEKIKKINKDIDEKL